MSEEDTGLNLPYGLDKNSIAPSTLEKLSKEGTDTFKLVSGRKRKNPFNQHKQAIEAKRLRDETETVEIMDDFISSFEGEKRPVSSGMAFVRGGTEGSKSSDSSDRGTLYQPAPRYTPRKKRLDTSPKRRSPSPPRKKRRAIDELKEEFAQSRRNRRDTDHYSHERRTTRDSHYSADDHSTNLFVTNLSPMTTEEELYDLFSRYGAIASVKIMWPYSEEERSRKRNRGFVAFQNRKSAEAAIQNLRGLLLHGNELGIGWGKAVRLPSHDMKRPSSSNSSRLLIVPPAEDRIRDVISKLAEYVAENGIEVEDMVLRKEINNNDFRFLHKLDSPENLYYRWRLHSFKQGDTMNRWSTAPFQFNNTGPMYIPPPLPIDRTPKPPLSPSQQKSNANKELTPEQVEAIERTLESLTASRNDILMAMGFLMRYTEQAQQVRDMLRSHILSRESVTLSSKVACLYLISDLLWNSSSVPNASVFRNLFEECIVEIFQHLVEAFKAITGRISAKKANERVLRVVEAWKKWALFSPELLDTLGNFFLPQSNVFRSEDDLYQASEQSDGEDENREETVPEFAPMEKRDHFDGESIDVDGEPVDLPIEIDNMDVDGESIDVDGEPIDIDGEPIDIDGEPIDIDGEPINIDGESIDIDGEPIDIDGEPIDIDGEPIDIDGEAIDVDGDPIDVDGEQINIDGEAANFDGEPINGNPLDIDGEPTEDGDPIDLDGVTVSAEKGESIGTEFPPQEKIDIMDEEDVIGSTKRDKTRTNSFSKENEMDHTGSDSDEDLFA